MLNQRLVWIVSLTALLAACETVPSGGALTQMSQSCVIGPAYSTVKTIPAGSKNDFIANVGDRVFFDFGRFALRADAKATLVKQVVWLKQYPNYSLTVEGHTDERGTREYNLALGERRASGVRAFLIASGVAPTRIKTVSYGKERPVAFGSNEVAWSQSRRGVIVLD